MANTLVEDEIKKHYLADDGMWLVEKGKIKEAKLLKEAHERITWLKSQYNYYYNQYNTERKTLVQPYIDERDELKKELEKQKQLNRRLVRLMDGIKSAVAEIVLIDGNMQ